MTQHPESHELYGYENVCFSVTVLDAGDEFTAKVEGGWVRITLPIPGFAVTVGRDSNQQTFFLPLSLVEMVHALPV